MLSGDLRQNHVGVGTRLVGVVQGYRPQVDWGGDSGSATIVVGGHNVRVATSGWRRRCLYILLLALLALSVMNLSLTLWILKTVHFNVDGMGHLHVVIGGLEMKGASEISQKMSVARIQGRVGEILPIKGYYNLTIHTREFNSTGTGDLEVNDLVSDPTLDAHPSYIHINVDNILARTKGFTVRDQTGKRLFHTDNGGSRVGAETFTVTGEGGAQVEGSMQTPHLYSKGVHELRLESVTRDVKIRSTKELRVEARNGDISAICSRDATLAAEDGAIRFDNPDIFIPRLAIHGEEELRKMGNKDDAFVTSTPTPQETQLPPPPPLSLVQTAPEGTTTPMTPRAQGDDNDTAFGPVQVFEVCVCPSGKLFVVAAANACVPDDDVCR